MHFFRDEGRSLDIFLILHLNIFQLNVIHRSLTYEDENIMKKVYVIIIIDHVHNWYEIVSIFNVMKLDLKVFLIFNPEIHIFW